MSCQLRLTAFSLMTSASQFPEIADAMQRAAQSHRAGNLDEAERIYRDVLARASDQFAALHALSVITEQRSDFLRAHELLQRTLAMARATAALCRGALQPRRGFIGNRASRVYRNVRAPTARRSPGQLCDCAIR